MKLYVVNGSPMARKVQALVIYLGLEVEIIEKQLMDGSLKTEEYLELNPNGKVPVLVDGNVKIWESNAILQYLADKSENDEVFPKDISKRYEIVKWQFWEAGSFNSNIGKLSWETIIKGLFGLGEPDQAIIDNALQQIAINAPVLEKQLDGKKFVVGDSLTIVDFSMAALSTLILSEKSIFPLNSYPNIKRWLETMNNVEAWSKTKPPFAI